VALRETFLAGLAELESDQRSAWLCLRAAAAWLPGSDFEPYVQALLDREQAPQQGLVPETIYWAVRQSEVVGRISLRHFLNEALLREGGHVGYIVRPSARRQGVASEMLRQLLLTGRARSLGRLLLTCDEDNLASEKSIRKNGGVLEDVLEPAAGQRRQKRFWIPVTEGPSV
jgi:predicted acetyltransferase